MKFVETYRELLIHKPLTLRDKARKLALDAVSAGYNVLHNKEKLFSRPRIQFLYIHHVFKDEESRLASLLKHLSGQHTFISHSEAVDKILSGTIDKSYISISSDDGLKNNMRAAAVMNDFGVKGCFFICPGMIGEKNPDKITDFCKNRLHFPPVEFMDWGDVHKLQAQGHEIGGHTMSHINIAATRADELTKEIADCYDIIKARCGGSVHFAYPYGLFSHFTEKARQLVIEKGFASCASAQRGCHIVEQDGKILPADLLIRRDHIILDWPLQHSLFFVERNAVKASVENNFYPALCA